MSNLSLHPQELQWLHICLLNVCVCVGGGGGGDVRMY